MKKKEIFARFVAGERVADLALEVFNATPAGCGNSYVDALDLVENAIRKGIRKGWAVPGEYVAVPAQITGNACKGCVFLTAAGCGDNGDHACLAEDNNGVEMIFVKKGA